ncbi:MAG: hypothetical protein JWL64_999 [Frankiales bacterium]|nr:hypothetical protein [Frankiales bacterium]
MNVVRRLRGARRPWLPVELLVVLCLLRVYDLAREHGEVRREIALQHGHDVLTAERWLHLDVERSLNHLVTGIAPVNWLASAWYQYAHTTVTMVVLLWIYARRPEVYRWARTALVLINVLGLTVFFLLPVAPPRLLPGAGFVDGSVVAGLSAATGPVQADQYGAMPSLHIAWAVWVATVCLVAVRNERRSRLWIGYPIVTTVVIVVTGNHFVLDAVAGLAVALVALSHHRAIGWARSPADPALVTAAAAQLPRAGVPIS